MSEAAEPQLIELGPLAVWHWPGDGPPIIFAHATGFHGRCWDAIIRRLPGRRAIAVDFRGHGRSAKPAPPYEWPAFGWDLAGILDHFEIRGAIGAGHSMGGHSLVLAAAIRPDAFSSLLLIDPTIFPPEYYGTGRHKADYIRRRRNVWSSPAEMIERFRAKPPFASWDREVLHDYCEFGLLPSEGHYVLACPPEVEASIYEHSNAPEASLYRVIPSIEQPVVILRADTKWQPGVLSLGASPTAPDLARRFPHGHDVLLPGSNHFFPMEHPDLIAEEITALLSRRTATSGEAAHP